VEKDGYYYLFASATNCCNGALTGYSVFVGRSEDPYGPFVDREGVSLLAGEVGGTPVLSMNGNRWVGTGHNSVFMDASGQWWTAYHAVDQQDPFFEGAPGFTKRPVLLDPIDWIDGWPTVRGGLWASDTRMPAPAAQDGQRSRYRTRLVAPQEPGRVLRSEQFDSGLDGWSWVREPDASTYEVADGVLRWDTQAGDLYVDSNSASVLTTRAPRGDYVVETRVRMSVPPEGCCFNYVQAGLVLYGDDDNFIKLVEASIWETRQTEFAKELNPVPVRGAEPLRQHGRRPPRGVDVAPHRGRAPEPARAARGRRRHRAVHRLHQPRR
jgi:arabinan endo-1,5-alpha-L-arabinosidase